MPKVDITIEAEDVLDELTLSDIIAFYGNEVLLEEITASVAMDYFGLVEPE